MQNFSLLSILLLSQFYLQVKVAKHWNGFLSHCILRVIIMQWISIRGKTRSIYAVQKKSPSQMKRQWDSFNRFECERVETHLMLYNFTFDYLIDIRCSKYWLLFVRYKINHLLRDKPWKPFALLHDVPMWSPKPIFLQVSWAFVLKPPF